MGPLRAAATPTPSPSTPLTNNDAIVEATRSCADGAFVCTHVTDWTNSHQVGLWTQTIVDGATRVLGIIVLGWILRIVATRLIKEFERRAISSNGSPLTGISRRITGVLDTGSVATVRRIQRIRAACSVLRNMTTVVIWSAVVLMVLSQIGLNIAPLLASAGIVGVAIGFGAQSLVKDFLTGLFMILEDQYGVGDRVDFGDAKGTVVAVGMRVTRVRADDSTMWYVPNGSIVRVGNLGQGWGRSIVDVQTSSPEQIDDVEDVLNEAAERISVSEWADDLALAPEMVTVEPLTHDRSTVRLLMKTRTGVQWSFNQALTDAVLRAAERRGVPLERVEKPAPMMVLTDPPSTTLAPAAPPAPLDPASSTLRVVDDAERADGRPRSGARPLSALNGRGSGRGL